MFILHVPLCALLCGISLPLDRHFGVCLHESVNKAQFQLLSAETVIGLVVPLAPLKPSSYQHQDSALPMAFLFQNSKRRHSRLY